MIIASTIVWVVTIMMASNTAHSQTVVTTFIHLAIVHLEIAEAD